MNARIIAPQSDLIEAVQKALVKDGRDYSMNLVVFPGQRPAHMLRKRLAVIESGPLLPPRIYAADSFIDYLYQEKLGKIANDVSDLDAAGLLMELQDVLSHMLVDDRNRKIESFLPFGLKLFQELEELKIGNASPPAVDIEINAFLDQYDMRELLYLRDFYRAFYEKLEEQGKSTRATRYATVAAASRDIDLTEWRNIVIAGYAAPNPAEKLLFERLAGEENVRFIFQDAEGLSLVEESFGRIHPEKEAAPAPVKPEFRLYESSDAHGQLFTLFALLQKLDEEGVELDEKTVIVVSKQETLFPLLAYGVGHIPEEKRNVSLGYPFNRTPVYEFIMALMRLLSTRDGERYFGPAYLDFILHPYTKNILFGTRTDVTRILLHTIQEEYFVDSSVSLFRLEDVLNNGLLFDRIVERMALLDVDATAGDMRGHLQYIHESTIGRLAHPASIGGVAEALAGVLRFIYEHSTARNHPFVLPFIQTGVKELERIAASGIAGHAFDVAASYERFFRRTLGGLREAFPGTPLRGLQILGLLETRNLKFDRVFVLDANEDVLPGGRGADMMLPQRMRERLGLTTYRQRDALSEHYFQLLCQGAKEVHLLYRTGNGMERSRFVEQIVWDIQRQAGSTSEQGLTKSIQYRVALQNPLPGRIEKTDEMMQTISGHSFSASGIDMYLSCPLKFYYHYILTMRKFEDVSGEIESSEIGNAVHEILEAYFTPLLGKPLTSEDVNVPRIEAMIREWFAAKYGSPLVGETLLVSTQVERRLVEFLRQYQVPLVTKHSITVMGLEEKIVVPSAGGVTLNGKLDRVESRDGIVHILDYKTGGALPSIRLNRLDPEARETWGQAIGSVQLPMYVKLYAAKHAMDPGSIVPLYVHLGRAQLDGKTEAGVGKAGTPTSEWYPQIDAIIDRLIGEIRDGNRPFNPPENPAGACVYCEFKTVCGTRWV